MNKKGFTLVEILAVIVILSLIITIVATKGFGVFDNVKKKIEEEQINLVKDYLDVLMLDVINCEDDDYEELKDYFKISKTINSCEELIEGIDEKTGSTIVNLEKLKEEKVISESDYEKISGIKFVVSYNKETNEKKIIITDTLVIPECNSPIPNQKLLYGDVDLSGEITEEDAQLIMDNLVGNDILSEVQIVLADVNQDNNISVGDSVIVQQYINGQDTSDTLVGKEYLSFGKQLLYGDVDLSGEITEEDAQLIMNYLVDNDILSEVQIVLADVNQDNNITAGDSVIVKQYINGQDTSDTLVGKPYLFEDDKFIFGDVDLSGEITNNDAQLIMNYLVGNDILSEVQIVLADVNQDNNISAGDSVIVQQYINGQDTSDTLVGKEYKKSNICGDINNDGKLDTNDISLLERYINKEFYINGYQKGIVDFNKDYIVNKTDLDFLKERLSK